jgi:hypothetical protein
LSIEKWREAHPGVIFPDNALQTMLPFPSLAINDYIHFVESRGDGADVVSFLKGVARELTWLYDNWAKEQFNKDGIKLMDDLVRNVPRGEAYSDQFFRFIRDYRDAHNLNWADPKDQSAWEEAMKQPPEQVTM